ncbi:MAG: GNAT family N-acetyltransferase [Planctomycetes bacterium]|nr:GNAT family N-acetyltransferase [Planctomycetota bacterium]
MGTATDIQVRAALPADWQEVRELCCESCSEPPFYLTGNEGWPTYGQEDWVDYSVGPEHAMFLLFDRSTSPPYPIGKARISTANGDPTTAVADGIYIRAAYRGRGLSKLLWEARITWARVHELRRITTIHRLSNVRSMRSILTQGFVETERIPAETISGATEPELVYELVL